MKNIKLYLISIYLVILTALPGVSQLEVEVQNSTPRRDIKGEIVDAHDGRVIQFGDRFYWYGTAYGSTNGFVTTNHYRCYSSSDLESWEYEGRLLPNQPEGVYYRPHVIYNESTGKYVLWYNWYPKLWDGQFGVAVSDVPQGPFEIVNDNLEMANSSYGLGDFGLFVDEDGTAYISYNTIRDHMVSIERLADDYLSSTGENGGVISKYVEAGSQFKRNGKYYLLTDNTCCFCNYGSGARVYISDDPLSGYRLTGNINRYPGQMAAKVMDNVKRGTHYETLEKSGDQYQALELQVSGYVGVSAIEVYLYTGNRNGQCGEVDNPRVHPEIVVPEFKVETWNYDTWSSVNITDTETMSSATREVVRLDVDVETTHLRVVPLSTGDDDYEIYVNEITLLNKEGSIIDIDGAYISGPDIPRRPIIPAQQTYVMGLDTQNGKQYIWMGDLWGSASDNVKGHDYQYWSAPLKFNDNGTILPLRWTDRWSINAPEEE